MKILQVLPTLSAGGAEGFVTNLAISLTALGAEARLFLLAGARGERGQTLLTRLNDAHVQVEGAEQRNIRSPINLLRLAGLVHAWEPDVIQANLYASEVLCAFVRACSFGSRTCFARRLADTSVLGDLALPAARRLDRSFDIRIACAPSVETAYRSIMGRRHIRSITTICNGGLLLDSPPGLEEKAEARRRIGVPETSFVITHIGGMRPSGRSNASLQTAQKAHDVLLRSFAEAFAGDACKRLVLVGDGPLRSEVVGLAHALGIARQVVLLGQQPEPWPALKAADVFCLPSRYEGLPNVLPEAASCGLPVVASDISEIRDLWPGDSWLLKPVNDVAAFAEGLRRVEAHHATFRDRAIDAAPALRERFSMKQCAERYMDTYQSYASRATALRRASIPNSV